MKLLHDVLADHVECQNVADPDEDVHGNELEEGHVDRDEQQSVFAELDTVHHHQEERRPHRQQSNPTGHPLARTTNTCLPRAFIHVHGIDDRTDLSQANDAQSRRAHGHADGEYLHTYAIRSD